MTGRRGYPPLGAREVRIRLHGRDRQVCQDAAAVMGQSLALDGEHVRERRDGDGVFYDTTTTVPDPATRFDLDAALAGGGTVVLEFVPAFPGAVLDPDGMCIDPPEPARVTAVATDAAGRSLAFAEGPTAFQALLALAAPRGREEFSDEPPF